jgi:hypothetical protein
LLEFHPPLGRRQSMTSKKRSAVSHSFLMTKPIAAMLSTRGTSQLINIKPIPEARFIIY